MYLTLLGLVIGGALGSALNFALRASLPRMGGLDPVTISLVALFLFGVALFACWIPARRALRINPVDALRAE
jgi:ABC-type antimicrobial peptide transport system permease subunit